MVLPEYDIEERLNDLPPLPKKPSPYESLFDDPSIPNHPSSAIVDGDKYLGPTQKRKQWDDGLWDGVGNFYDTDFMQWATDSENLGAMGTTDSVLENALELVPSKFTVGLNADDIYREAKAGDTVGTAFESLTAVSPYTRVPRRYIRSLQASDWASDTYNDQIKPERFGRQEKFTPWGQYQSDKAIAKNKEKLASDELKKKRRAEYEIMMQKIEDNKGFQMPEHDWDDTLPFSP